MSSSTIAVVGASPRNFWTGCAIHNLRALNPDLAVVPVSPNHREVDGLPAVASVGELPEAPRAAVIAIRREASVAAVRELTAMGTADIVLVSDGFDERGDDIGRRLHEELVEIVSGTATKLWGPNCVGFVDFHEQLCAVAEPVWLSAEPGPVSVISQSGALLSAFIAAATEEGLGLDFCASTGNGAVRGVAETIEFALRRSSTRIICAYLEGIAEDQLPAFLAAFERARAAGKQIIVLKSGVSERGGRVVLSHTASISGTDSVLSELLREQGVIRADGIDEMMRLATLCACGVKHGRPRAVSVLGGSGGAAALCSDLAEQHGVHLTEFADETVERIRELAGPGSFIDNPLDVIGVRRREGAESVNARVFADSGTGLVLLPWSIQFPSDSPEQAVHTWNWEDLARLSRERGMPLVITSMAPVPVTEWVRDYRRRHPDIAVVHNLRLTFTALAKLFPAHEHGEASASGTVPADERLLSEADSRDLVQAAGVPVVRGVRVGAHQDPATAAQGLRPPFAVKVIAPVGHKSRIGGVALGVSDVRELPAVTARIARDVNAAGVSPDQVEGYLVEEMVFGSELLIGLNTDPVLGKYVVVGVGGTATELANRSTTRRLPLRAGDPRLLLRRAGVVDHGPASEALVRLCAAFESGTLAGFETVEINPLIVAPAECWAADAVITRTASASELTTSND